jgi:hypothetical protein
VTLTATNAGGSTSATTSVVVTAAPQERGNGIGQLLQRLMDLVRSMTAGRR